MRASLTKMVGSHSLVSWRWSQTRTFQIPPFFHVQILDKQILCFLNHFENPLSVSLLYTPKPSLAIRLRKLDLTIIPRNVLLLTDISRLCYLMTFFLVVLYSTELLGHYGFWNTNLVILESRQHHQPSFGPGRIVLEDRPRPGVKGKPAENDR